MPTPPYAKLLVSVNGGPPQSGGITVENGDSIEFEYEATAFWDPTTPARLEFFAYPSGWTGPGAPWSSQTVTVKVGDNVFPFTVYYYLGSTPPPAFTMPSAGMWGKFLPLLLVNGGTKNGVASADLIDRSTGLEIVSPLLGLHDLARFEGAQFGGAEAWVHQQAENLRTLNEAVSAALAAASGAVQSVGAAAPITVDGSAADPVIGISAATADDPGSMSSSDKAKLDDATAAATPGKLMLRDGSGGVAASYVTSGAPAPSGLGVLRGGTGEVLVGSKTPGGDDVPVLTDDGAAGIDIGHATRAEHVAITVKDDGHVAAILGTIEVVRVDQDGLTVTGAGKAISIEGLRVAQEVGGAMALGPADADLKLIGGAGSSIIFEIGLDQVASVNPDGSIAAVGVRIPAIPIKTSAYTLTEDDNTIEANATGGAFTIGLPPAAQSAGRDWTVIKIDASANAVTIDGNGAETINGALTHALTTQWQSATYRSNGTSWRIVARA